MWLWVPDFLLFILLSVAREAIPPPVIDSPTISVRVLLTLWPPLPLRLLLRPGLSFLLSSTWPLLQRCSSPAACLLSGGRPFPTCSGLSSRVSLGLLNVLLSLFFLFFVFLVFIFSFFFFQYISFCHCVYFFLSWRFLFLSSNFQTRYFLNEIKTKKKYISHLYFAVPLWTTQLCFAENR